MYIYIYIYIYVCMYMYINLRLKIGHSFQQSSVEATSLRRELEDVRASLSASQTRAQVLTPLSPAEKISQKVSVHTSLPRRIAPRSPCCIWQRCHSVLVIFGKGVSCCLWQRCHGIGLFRQLNYSTVLHLSLSVTEVERRAFVTGE